jgi:hypothetical protein
VATGRAAVRARATRVAGRRGVLIAAALLAACSRTPATPGEPAPAATPGVGVLANGLFREGRAGVPSAWAQSAYDGSRSRFAWTPPGEGPGVATIENREPNDASWVQRVPVAPGAWYLVSGWMRAVNVAETGAGVRLSVLRSYRESEHLRGTTDWRRVGLWVQAGPGETALDVACRIGGNAAVVSGTLSCTGVSVEAALPPDLEAPRVFADPTLDTRSRRATLLGAAALAAGALLLLAWRFLAPEPWRYPP